MEVSYSTMIAAGNLVKRLAQNARRLEKALAETMNTSAEWKRIADELKAERNALRSTTIDTAAGRLLDAFGSLTNEPRNGAPDDEYRDRIVNKIHSIKMERDALRAECDDLRRVFSLVHGSLGIQQGQHIGNAIDALKKERDELATRLRQSIARGDFAEMRLATLAAELDTERDRHKQQPKTVRAHPVKVGEWVERTDCGYLGVPSGTKGRVIRVRGGYYDIRLGNNEHGWCFEYCTPCDPPEAQPVLVIKSPTSSVPCDLTIEAQTVEASHITPEGKQTAEGAVEPKPGDVVRLVRVPTNDEYPHDSGRWEPNWGGIGDYMRVHYVGFGLEWPLSCVEVVKGGDK